MKTGFVSKKLKYYQQIQIVTVNLEHQSNKLHR